MVKLLMDQINVFHLWIATYQQVLKSSVWVTSRFLIEQDIIENSRETHIKCFMKFLFVTYTFMYACTVVNCIAHHAPGKNYLKITRLPDIKEMQRFSSSIQQKRRNCYESQERNFHATVVTGVEVFDLASIEGEFCLVLYFFVRAFK